MSLKYTKEEVGNLLEYTTEEVRDLFLEQIASLVDHWINEDRAPKLKDKMNGLVHSILVIFDGKSSDMPAFIVAPMPHKNDKDYNINKGNEWFPENISSEVHCDIAGVLHDTWDKLRP